jgi:hypothetical protein
MARVAHGGIFYAAEWLFPLQHGQCGQPFSKKEPSMYHNPFDLFLCAKTYHEEMARRASKRRPRPTWQRVQLGRVLSWLGQRLSRWGQQLQLPPTAVEYQGN